MKQALHIFRKDVRRLWPLALVVVILFALYGISPRDKTDWPDLLAILSATACWTVGAHLIHDDALADESPFWITRPYSRISLLAAKTLFLFVFEFLPLLASGILIEARSGVNVLLNAGHMLALDVAISLWLILPILAIGAVTNNIRAFAATASILFIAYTITSRLTRTHLDMGGFLAIPDVPNVLAVLPMMLAAFCIVAVQYALRRTLWSRAVLAIAIIASAFLMQRNSIALASNHIVSPPPFDLQQIQIAFARNKSRLTKKPPSLASKAPARACR